MAKRRVNFNKLYGFNRGKKEHQSKKTNKESDKLKRDNKVFKKCLRIALDRLEELKDYNTINKIKEVANDSHQ